MPLVEILEASLAEVAIAAELFDGYRQFYGEPANLEGAMAFLTARLERRESIVLLAVTRTSQVGLGLAQVYPSFSSVRMKPLWILNDLFVVPGARRCGIGRCLLNEVIQRAILAGACRVVLATAQANTPAKALYESTGFVRLADYDHYARPLPDS